MPLESAAWASVAGAHAVDLQWHADHRASIQWTIDPFWPVQTARLTLANGRSVYGALQFRPGMELWSFCRSHEGADEVAVFDRIAHSVGAPNDTEIQINAERLAEERQRMSEVERTTMEAQRMRLQEFAPIGAALAGLFGVAAGSGGMWRNFATFPAVSGFWAALSCG